MKRLTFTVLLSLLLTQALCTITVKNGLPKGSLFVGDTWSRDLANIFDLTQAIPPIKFSVSSSGAKVLNQLEAFLVKHYDYLNLKNLHFAKVLSEKLIALVYDNNRVILQEVDHAGLALGERFTFKPELSGVSLFCSDFAFNKGRNIAYVGCFDKNSSEANPGSTVIFTLDLYYYEIQDKVVVPQTDGFRIINRLSMFLHTFPTDENKDVTLLFVYDQGHTSQSENSQPRKARTFSNINSRVLEYDALLTTEIDGQNFDIIYDYYSWKGSIIATTKMTGKGGNIFLAHCKLDINEDLIKCGSKVRATPVSHGKVLIHEGEFYAEIDVSARELRYYELHGAFTDINWNTDEIASLNNLNFPPEKEEQIWIRGMSISSYGGVIHYGQANHQDPGSTFVEWATGVNEYSPAQVGLARDRDFFVAVQSEGKKRVGFAKMEPIFYLDGYTWGDYGFNKIAIVAEDANSRAVAEGNFYLLNNVHTIIDIKNTIGTIEMHSHQTLDIAINPDDVIFANEVEAIIESEKEYLVSGTAFTNEPISIKFSGRKGDHFDGELIFSQDRALIRTSYGTIIWTRCSLTQEEPKSYTCYEDGQHVVGKDETFTEKIFVAGEVIAALSHNSKSSNIHLMNTKGEIRHFGFEETVNDFGILNTQTFTFVILAFSDRVDIYSFNRFDIQEFNLYRSYSAGNSKLKLFCPTKIQIPPGTSNDFDILTNCGDEHPEHGYIIRWGIDDKAPYFKIPLSIQNNPSDFCAFENEFLVNGKYGLYGIPSQNDLGIFKVPHIDLASDIYDIFCLKEIGKAVMIGRIYEGGKSAITVIKGDSGSQQGRRYPTFITDIEAKSIKVFEFMGEPLHIINNGEQRDYIRSYSTPILRMKTGSVRSETDVAVKIIFTNGWTEQEFYQHVTVLPK